MPNQENKLKPGHIIDCRVLAIKTKLMLKQENINDPFFYTFDEIVNDEIIKSKYFLPYLIDKEDTYSIDLTAQYDSKSAFWVFTYCNKLLPRLFYSAIYCKNYLHASEINQLLLIIENWILKNGILYAFNNDDDREESKKKVEVVIKKLLLREQILPMLENIEDRDFLYQSEQIQVIELHEYLSLADFTSINEVIFTDLIEKYHELGLKEEDNFFLNKIGNIIEKNKRYFISDLKEDHFIITKKLSEEQKLKLNKYLIWSYCQYLIYDLTSENIKKNLVSGQILKFWVQSTANFEEKKTLLYNAFYILSNNELESSIPIKREGGIIDISINQLHKNPNLSNNKYWDEIACKDFNVHKVNVIEKYYQGYKVQSCGLDGFLPIQNITDVYLKRNPFKNINWETNVEIHLFSKEFNFFVAKQFNLNSLNYYSKSLFNSVEVGSIIPAQVNTVQHYGIFLITPFGDGLLHKDNISDQYWDKRWLEVFFKPGMDIYVKVLYKTDEKIELGFKQLIGTEYEKYYNKFLYSNNNNYDFEVDSDAELSKDIIDRQFEIEKGYIFEQFAIIQESFEDKIKYIKLAKQFFANTENARSYLHNIYIEYFTALNELNDVVKNYSFERYNSFRERINSIKESLNPQTLQRFSESENLIFFINILSLFNINTNESDSELMEYIKKYSLDDSKTLLKILAKTTLANNLLLSEGQKTNNGDGIEFSSKNLKRIRDYIQYGVFSLAETEEDRLAKELKEKIYYWSEKIKLDEGEKLEFKSTFITPVPDAEKQRILANLYKQLNSLEEGKGKNGILNKIDEIKGDTAQKKIVHSALKAIAAFANTNGGHLLLGVSNDKSIYGLENDYDSFTKKTEKNRDGFGKFFDSKVKEYLGNSFSSMYLEKEFLKFPEGDILIINVKPGKEEVFLLRDELANSSESLYIRNLSSTEKLEGRELAKFIRSKFREQLK